MSINDVEAIHATSTGKALAEVFKKYRKINLNEDECIYYMLRKLFYFKEFCKDITGVEMVFNEESEKELSDFFFDYLYKAYENVEDFLEELKICSEELNEAKATLFLEDILNNSRS